MTDFEFSLEENAMTNVFNEFLTNGISNDASKGQWQEYRISNNFQINSKLSDY